MIEGFDSYQDNVPDNSPAAIAYRFDKEPGEIDYADIKVAVYEYESYSGNGFVLYQDTRDGLYYEVHCSHCSCYGCEGQWEPERISAKELRNRPYFWEGSVRDAIHAALEGVEQEAE